MIFIALQHCFSASQHRLKPLLIIIGQRKFVGNASPVLHPSSVRLKVSFVNDVKPVAVAKFIKPRLIGIMRSPDGVYIVAFHCDNIIFNHGGIKGASVVAIELVTIDALKDNALAVNLHDVIAELKFPEANIYRHDFAEVARAVFNAQNHSIKIGLLGTPKLYAF